MRSRWAVLFLLSSTSLGCAGGDETDTLAVPTADGSADSTFTDGAVVDGSDDSSFVLDGAGCLPKTCAEQGKNCGPVADGCGGLIASCGSCTAPEFCGGGGASVCGVGETSCVPKTCAELGASCGKQGDGCGGLIECGTCTAPATCGGGGVPNVCGSSTPACTPKKCADMGYDCGPVADGCGGLVDCGKCSTGTCGGGGKPNVCGSSTSPCLKKTCGDWGANCGPVSDGCGGLTASCGTCSGGNTCGGGGVASVCGGAPPTCTKKTCADYPGTCGPQPDGCGGLTPSCGSCTLPQTCGGGGVPSKCGGGPAPCTKKTCSDYPSGTCGQVSDGCGGLTSDCGTCTGGNICGGGGVPSVCGGGGGTSCVNLECKQVKCTTGTSSISGTVFDPAGVNPLYNVFVYIPNGTPTAFVDGATCDKCADALSGYPLVQTVTDEKGKFKLTNVPVGTNIPLVIQTGKWRRQVKINTAACIDTPIDASLTRLPRNKTEGDIPRIALSTGGFDSLECLLRKIGVSDSEFTNPTGTGRINLYRGRPLNSIKVVGPGGYTIPAATKAYASSLGGASFPDSTTLWADATSLRKYDVVLLSCEGDQYGDPSKTYYGGEAGTKSTASLKAMFDYVNGGGRVFASHYHDYWLQNGPGTGTAAWSTLASWNYPSAGLYNSKGIQQLDEKLITSFTKGSAMANWLVNVGGSTTLGVLPVKEPRNSVKSIDSSRVLEWIYEDTGYVVSGSSLVADGRRTQYMSFNAPVEAAAGSQCGRFVFSDIHVSSGDSSGPAFPSECSTVGMSPQEKALEFMLFDLSSRVCDDKLPPPPPSCTKRTCADQGIECGPAPDGCGGTITSCGTCTTPLVCSTGGKCAGSTCTPTTCPALGYDCGSWPNGCGGTLSCGSCTAPATCGGTGIPGKCGGSSCTKKTCTEYGYDCGSWADGCGGVLDCGTCVAPATCGGTGIPGKCGGTGCVKKTCAEMGVSCGPSGDGCGGTLDCGTCDAGSSCTPLTCGGRCGPQGDGCGGILTCPACEGGSCVKTSCSAAGAECGSYPDGCGGLLDCGTCPSPKTCGAAGPNKCGTIG